MTEIHFGLHSAGHGHLVRHGSPGQGSMYLRTAINSQSPWAAEGLRQGSSEAQSSRETGDGFVAFSYTASSSPHRGGSHW